MEGIRMAQMCQVRTVSAKVSIFHTQDEKYLTLLVRHMSNILYLSSMGQDEIYKLGSFDRAVATPHLSRPTNPFVSET
jgi:hypothetical protein